MLLVIFLMAGTGVPLQGASGQARWVVLAIGAVAGLLLYMHRPEHHFGVFHLVASFSVLGAYVSALVSGHPVVAGLKATSLFLLFLYGSAGARLALLGREEKLFSALLLACEGLVYFTFGYYFLLGIPLFGNPNSLGAMMGVVVVPFLLWGVLATARPRIRYRRMFALGLASILLLGSYARAGIASAVISCVVLCVVLKQYRLLLQGLVTGLLAASMLVTFVHLKGDDNEHGSVFSTFVYKGKEGGVLASRLPVWEKTKQTIGEHPYFGTGFGTSSTNDPDASDQQGVAYFSSTTAVSHEHGSSYLAIVEWVGLLGIVPFALLLLLILRNVIATLGRLRKTGDPHIAAAAIVGVVMAGLIHAAFEDWMFAPGYYISTIFWIFAFLLVDVAPRRISRNPSPSPAPLPIWTTDPLVVAPHR